MPTRVRESLSHLWKSWRAAWAAAPRRAAFRRRPWLEGLEDRCLPALVIHEFAGLTADIGGPTLITAGPDGNLWFTEEGANQIGRITPQGALKEFPIPTAGSSPYGITAGPDGNLWFTQHVGKIGRITPQGAIKEFPVRTADGSLNEITAGPDGNLWFTESYDNKIGRMTPKGAEDEFALPTESNSPEQITAGPDGNLWFTELGTNQIGRITPQGAIKEFPVPTVQSGLEGITAGSDGNLWFAELGANQIGRITPQGAITEFGIPSAPGGPLGITAGHDGNLWFTEQPGDQIGEAVLPHPPPPGQITVVDFSALIAVLRQQPGLFQPQSGRWRQRLTLRNDSGTTIEGPLFLVLDHLPRRVHLCGAAGLTEAQAPLGDPFVELPVSLAPG
jgi:streptogramin lyase